ncbi:MAG: M28 family peptidase [Cellulosilyticaceae bacterium]
MKKIAKLLTGLLATTVLCTSTVSAKTLEIPKSIVLEQDQRALLEAIDTDYSLGMTKKLTTFGTHETLGYRTAGSTAEHEAAEMLYEEFQKIGLQNVRKDAFEVDSWEFKKAELTYADQDGQVHTVTLGGYPSEYITHGVEEVELVYAGKGTKFDYENLDVKDKIVLVDIDQREEWWINYPAYEAYLNGAKAIIAANIGGYGEASDTALNTQDMCGPEYAPAFSISNKDANALKQLLADSETGTLKVQFEAESVVEEGGTSYNVIGKIPGKDPDQIMILSGHYDAYYKGFQDDGAAIGLIMGLAKAIVDSGYQPEKTIVVIAHGAEEWGLINSRYDWSVGAYNQVFKLTPKWQEMAFAMFNFEGAGYKHTDQHQVISVYEYKDYLEQVVAKVPAGKDVYPEGIYVTAPLGTWSDDFSYAISGIPALRNGYNGSEYSQTIYHSQLDTEETFSQEAYDYHHYLYGLLLLEFDQKIFLPMDFSKRFEAMKATINEEVFALAGADKERLTRALDQVIAAADKAYQTLSTLENTYQSLLAKNQPEEAEALKAKAQATNKELRRLFKYCEDQFVRLTWEDGYRFPHQTIQSNIANLDAAVKALEAGNVQEAYDEYISSIDNNFYAYDFSKETFEFFTNQAMNQPADRLNWGAGRLMGHTNLYDIIESLSQKLEMSNPDVSQEIKVLQEAKQAQMVQLSQTVETLSSQLIYTAMQLEEMIK